MRAATKTAVATLAGIALAAAHAALVPALVDATGRPALDVRWPGPLVAEHASEGVASAPAITSRDGGAPGLVWHRFTVRYRGGVERSVGAVQLVGPFQDPAAPPCGGRLVVGQRLLDDGRAGAARGDGTIAAIIAGELERELAGRSVVGAGDFVRVDEVRAAWATFVDHPLEVALFPKAAFRAPSPVGYFRATATVVFDRVRVPVVIGAVPRIDAVPGAAAGGPATSLGFTVGVRARLDFGNRTLDWLNERVGGDQLLTRAVSAQLDTALLAALGAPPPLELPGGRALVVELCPDRAVDVAEGAWAAVPLRWKLGDAVPDPAGGPPIRPPRRGPVAFTAPPPDAAVTLDLDLDALDGLLFELWRTGWLDERLDEVAAHDRFNRDETVAAYLTLRLSPLRLALPPTLRPVPGGGLALDLALRVDLADGRLVTPGHAWASLALALRDTDDAGRPAFIAADVGVTALELSCEPSPGLMRPCYGDVVAAIRDAAPGAHAQLAGALTSALTGVFAPRRLDAAGAPAALDLAGARARIVATGAGGADRFVRIAMDGTISPRPPR